MNTKKLYQIWRKFIMTIKDFLKDWKPKELKKMGKDDRTWLLYDSIPTIVDFFIKKSHKQQTELNELFDRMEDPKFAKTLKRILKTNNHEEQEPVDYGMATVIATFIERRHNKLDEELKDLYSDLIDKILKDRIKKVAKKTGLDKDLIKELLVVVADKQYISSEHFVGLYVNRMLRKIYLMARDNEVELGDNETLTKLFTQLFDKALLNKIAMNILLEKKGAIRGFNDNQKAVWNQFTNFALDVLASNKKKEIREELEYYVMRRVKDAKNNRDEARRIQFASISEDYKKITSVVSKMSEKDQFAQYL